MEKKQGSDGLPADFYNLFWSEIQDFINDSIIYIMSNGELVNYLLNKREVSLHYYSKKVQTGYT